MGLLGSIIGGGIGAVGSIIGGNMAAKSMSRVKGDLQQQRQANEDWYNRRYNEDVTQRADAQAILTRTEEAIRQRNRQAAGAQAVSGGTEEAVAAAKAANAQAMADATQHIAISGERRKDMVESQYLNKDEALRQQINDIEIGRSQAATRAVKGMTQLGADAAGVI